VTNIRSKCSQIRDRLTPHRNPLQSPSITTNRAPVHSTPRQISKETPKIAEKKSNFFKKIFAWAPWWFWIPFLLFLFFIVFPHSICKPFEHYPESKLYQNCRSFNEFVENATHNLTTKLRDDFSQSFRYAKGIREYFVDKLDDFRQMIRRWFSGFVKQPVGEALDTAKDFCDSGMQKVNHLIDEVKREREKLFGTKNALEPEKESQLQQLIQHILDEYAADETGQADYALEANGAKVVGTRCTEYTDEPRQNVVKFLGIPIVHMSKQPDIMLKAGRLPGQCFPFKGDQGSVIIKLAVPVKPAEFVLEHLSKSISIVGHINSAPKNFTVIALADKSDQEGRVLGRYFYDAENGPSLQRFSPQLPNVPLVEFIEVRVTSNWGNPNYTCLYRFRVHGDLRTAQPAGA